MAEFLRDFEASGLVGIWSGVFRRAPGRVDRRSVRSGRWRSLAQAVTRDAVRPRDPAGAEDVVVVVFGLGQSPVRVAGAGELGGGEGLGPVDQLALLRVSMGTTRSRPPLVPTVKAK